MRCTVYKKAQPGLSIHFATRPFQFYSRHHHHRHQDSGYPISARYAISEVPRLGANARVQCSGKTRGKVHAQGRHCFSLESKRLHPVVCVWILIQDPWAKTFEA